MIVCYVLNILKIMKPNIVTTEMYGDKHNKTFAILEIVPFLYSGQQVF